MSPAPAAFSFDSAPIPPASFPAGRGRFLVYFAGGFAPGTPALNRLRHLQPLPCGHPAQGACGSPQKTIGSGSLLAVPAAKERGDRGRWNYPSQATAAFEMVLSPGQGEQVPPGARRPSGHHSGRDSQCRRGQAAPPGTTAAGRTSAAGGKLPPPPSKIFLPPPIFIFCSPIYGILKQEKPEGV